MSSARSLVDLLLELETLDRVPRAGYYLRGVADPESVAEHSFHLAFLVWSVGRRVAGLDLLRALELALVHDLAEVRIGDLPRTALHYFPQGTKPAAERAALLELLAPAGRHAEELVREYEAGESAEARFVRACDRLQLLFKVALYERWGAGGLREFWEDPEFDDAGFPELRRLFDELSARRQA